MAVHDLILLCRSSVGTSNQRGADRHVHLAPGSEARLTSRSLVLITPLSVGTPDTRRNVPPITRRTGRGQIDITRATRAAGEHAIACKQVPLEKNPSTCWS